MMTQNTDKKREQIQMFCMDDMVPSEIFVDATHVKARANNRKMQKCIARQEAQFFEGMLKKEINEDRVAHGKKELKEKDKDDDDHTPSGGGGNAKKQSR